MSISGRIYDLSLRGLRGLSPLVAGGSGKVGRGVEGRRRDREAFRRWAEAERDPGRPFAWFHAPSVGEGLQARAVLRALREECPELQSAFSYFSPSAEGLARRLEVDVAAYLPWDIQSEVGPTLDALRPDLLVFTKTEVWPGLTAAARSRGIPVVLVAATLPENAGRLSWPGRLLLRRSFRVLERVVTISTEDGARFLELGVKSDRVEVAGDPAMDSVLERIRNTDPAAPHLRVFERMTAVKRTLVAGSTWGPDEAVLIPALTRLRERLSGEGHPLRLVIAPHEPDPDHLVPLEARLRAHGWTPVRLSDADGAPGADAVVVDRVGVLAELYTLGDVAFVGGGFGTDGLHSVLEPAAAGVPVLFGPHHRNARSAGELQAVGAARAVEDEAQLVDALGRWLDGEAADAARMRAGTHARRYIEAHQGASRATARILDRLISHTRSSKEFP